MPLFLNRSTDTGASLADLFVIVRCDGGLGQVTGTGQVDQVTYAKSGAGAGQDRIEALVGGTGNIVISAAPSGTLIPDGQGGTVPINLVGGVTFAPDANGIIQVAYCFDNRMFAFDTGGNRIELPRSVILFHELAHAFHRANGSFNSGDPEFQAITDENAYRNQVGLTNRDPNNHDGGEGTGNGQTIPGCSGMAPGGGGNGGCCTC